MLMKEENWEDLRHICPKLARIDEFFYRSIFNVNTKSYEQNSHAMMLPTTNKF